MKTEQEIIERAGWLKYCADKERKDGAEVSSHLFDFARMYLLWVLDGKGSENNESNTKKTE